MTIRDVPPDVRDELAARAMRSGRSLQEYLRSELILLARRPTADEVLARARARKAVTGGGVPADRILAERDAARR